MGYKAYRKILCCLIIAIITIVSDLMAQGPASCGDTTVISSLPYTISSGRKCYRLAGNLTTNGSGITIEADSVSICLGNDTLTFGSGGGDDNYGIGTGWGKDFITITGGAIIHDKGSMIDSATSNRCLYLRLSHNVWIHDVDMIADGIDGKCIENNTGGYNIDIDGGTYRSDSRWFINRCQLTGAVIFLNHEGTLPSDAYDFKIHDLTITDGPHVGIHVGGTALAYIYNNHITLDGRNDLYDTADYRENLCHSRGDNAGIDIFGLKAGSKIYSNVIRSGTANGGCQGILLCAAKGTEMDSVCVYYNDIDIHTGPDLAALAGKCWALYWRSVPGSRNSGNVYNHIHDNIFKATYDTDSATWSIGRRAEAVSINMTGDKNGTNNWDTIAHNTFERNRTIVTRSGSDAGFTEATALGYGYVDTLTMPEARMCVDNVFRHNYWECDGAPVSISNSRGLPGNNLLMIGDTLVSHDEDSSAIVFDQSGAYGAHSTGNRLRDCIFIASANDSDVIFANQTDGTDSIGQDVRFERTLQFYVKGNNGQPVTNANIWVINNYGRTVIAGTTNAGGLVSGVVSYRYFAKDRYSNDTYKMQDSLAYNPFTLKAKKSTDSSSASYTITKTAACDTLTLINTIGDGTWGAGGEQGCTTPPTSPAQSSPANGATVPVRPTLCVNNSSGGSCLAALTYHFQIASNSGMTTIVAELPGISQGLGTTCYTPSMDLNRGQTYYWRARAFNGTTYSGWSTVRAIIIENTNNPPTAPTLSSPASGSVVTVLNPVLTINNSADPDGNTLTYNIQVATSSGFTSISAEIAGLTQGTGSTTAWTVSPNLVNQTSYYWHARAYDGTAYSGWSSSRSFTVQRSNAAPSAPTLASPGSGAIVTVLNPVLTINNSTDPDGNTIVYNIQIATSSSFSTIVTQVTGLAQGTGSTTAWTVSPNLANQTSYYWRARAYDSIVYSGWSSSRSFTVRRSNSAPSVPTLLTPTNGATVSLLTPALTINNSTDSEGNTITYSFQVSSNSNFTAIVSQANNVAQGSGSTTVWTVNSTLTNLRNYWWRVRAYDGSLYSAYSQVQVFYTNVSPNDPPTPPQVNQPPSGGTVTSTTPTLIINNSSDPQGDPLTYYFQVWNSQKSSLLASSPSVPQGAGTTTSWQVSIALSRGAQYNWRCRSYDGRDSAAWMSWCSFTVAANNPPASPTLYIPTDGDTVVGASHNLIVFNSSDPDGDPITYGFRICSDPGMTQVVEQTGNVDQGVFLTTSYQTTADLNNGSIYYWQSCAYDGKDYSSWSSKFRFTHYDISVGVEDVPIPLGPLAGATVASIRPSFQIQVDESGVGIEYYFEVADNAEFNAATASGPVIGIMPVTSWIPEVNLRADGAYYWRARAEQSGWSESIGFTVGGDIHIAPNPYRPSEHGDKVTFKNIPAGSTIRIATVSGELVREFSNLPGPDFPWDVTNEQGQPLGSGVYLYYVIFRNGSASGKLAVIR